MRMEFIGAILSRAGSTDLYLWKCRFLYAGYMRGKKTHQVLSHLFVGQCGSAFEQQSRIFENDYAGPAYNAIADLLQAIHLGYQQALIVPLGWKYLKCYVLYAIYMRGICGVDPDQNRIHRCQTNQAKVQ